MRRLLIWVIALGVASSASAQSLDDLNVQIHGYAAQGALYTTHNNIFYTNSSNGSAAWTEAVMNVSLQPTPALRVGVQARYQLLGYSGNAISLDWAAADYKVSDRFGVRAGKVKTPWGLFNETQDIDPSYMWALLPQSIYDITTRESDLAHYGAIAYGSKDLETLGKFDYRLWGGEQVVPKDDGQFDDLNEAGNGPLSPLEYITYGAALHWRTPILGFMLGASDARNNRASVALNEGSESFAAWNNLSYFGMYERRKLMLASEWNRQASPASLLLTGQRAIAMDTDTRGWYGMASYRATKKLSVGVYDSQSFDRDADLGPDRFTKDWTVSGRYDVNDFIYLKMEEHFLDGTQLSLDAAHNPAPVPVYRLTAIRVGVSF